MQLKPLTWAPAQQQQQQQQPAVQPPRGGQQLTETPQVVVDRMFKRVITFAGLPVVTGMLLFPVFWYLRVRREAGMAYRAAGSSSHLNPNPQQLLHRHRSNRHWCGVWFMHVVCRHMGC